MVNSWGNYPKGTFNELSFQHSQSSRNELLHCKELIPFGNGRSYGDSALGKNIVHLKPYNYFLAFDDASGTLHIQAGVLLSEILEVFVPKGWFLKITPGTKLITIGGAIASDIHGKNHHVAGCFSECVEEFSLLLPDNSIHTCRQGDELFHATCGGMGLTGIILDAKITLKKIRSRFIKQKTIKTRNLKETFTFFEEEQQQPYSVAWVDCLSTGEDLGKCLLMTGDFATDGDLSAGKKRSLGIPCYLPSFTLNKLTVTAFNWLYYKKAPAGQSKQRVDIDSFFYPLDAIENWNRIYGRNGFTQYQFILPLDSSYEGLHEILSRIARSGKGSFLSVLKLYGEENSNLLSFPMKGYSLALDFKIEKGLFQLLDLLDKIVVEHGGRIYLTKDVRMSRGVFEQGYPEVEQFRRIRDKYGMSKIFHSLQSKRLGL